MTHRDGEQCVEPSSPDKIQYRSRAQLALNEMTGAVRKKIEVRQGDFSTLSRVFNGLKPVALRLL